MEKEETYSAETSKARNKEALLTAGMGYGKRKRETLAAFWSIVWPGLENIGWKRIVGEGNDKGSVMFLPPGIKNTDAGKRNTDCYDKIRSVINRLEERRSVEEGKILDSFNDKVQIVGVETETLATSRPKRGTRRPRLGVSRPSLEVPEIDTSWKDGEIDTSWKDARRIYPKRSSQVGVEHQVEFLPRAGTFETQKKSDEPKYDVVWNWRRAEEKGVLNFVEENVPQDKREKALQRIHDNNYSILNTRDFIDQIDQSNLSKWTAKDKEKFHFEIFRNRKNFKALSESMDEKEMGDIIAYYLGQYKKSDDYRLLKTVRVEERIEKAEQSNHDVDHCAICGEGGNLLICDGCESEWHMECTKPALKTIPEGHWECDVCIDSKFLEGRKRILENIQKSRKRRKLSSADIGVDGAQDLNTGSTCNDMDTIEALKAFSQNITSILTKASLE